MKFTLTFDGELPSTGNSSKKVEKQWDIRKHFHPQLEELWRVHPALAQVKKSSSIPKTGLFVVQQSYHDDTAPTINPVVRAKTSTGELVDLCEPINVGSRNFLPLVRNSFALTCGLKILFLRKGASGKVYQGGDLDNRIKTLMDALSMPPNPDHVVDDRTIVDPVHCLMENDSLITGMTVETERLLSSENSPESNVRLIIEVDVRVADARSYNQSFLGN